MLVPTTLPAVQSFEPWLRSLPGFESARVRAIVPVTGGASNITCHVTLEGAPAAAVALRVQRERGIFEPYDVLREGRVLSALAGSPIPVPRLLAAEAEPGFLGAPFIVLEWVDAPHMGEAGPEASFPAFTAAVAAIHALDWRGLGLGFLSPPASPALALAAELAAVAARRRAFAPQSALLAHAESALRASIPGDGRLALCQGDINVFNYLFRGGNVVAVVDWEQARISDPRSDVGQLVALSHLKGAPFGPAAEMPFVRMYEASAGVSLGAMEFFRARWLWELGVIYHGWKAFNDSEPWYGFDDLTRLLELALTEL
ncbi:MAG: phosphotransferase family protein [Chloroflexi bacterium]|nr:phosphotransferase family protein [Chloroflexota bacterium]